MVNLERSVDDWANEIRNGLSKKRCDTYGIMVEAGFDINELVLQLTKIYERVGEEDVI